MSAPPDHAIAKAVEMTSRVTCQKSRRGAVIFDPQTDELICAGWNSPPVGRPCDGSKACRESCARRCIHAEETAVRWIYMTFMHGSEADIKRIPRLELVHVKVVDGKLVAGGGPSCSDCSKEILNSGIAAVWLYELPTVSECSAVGVFHMDDPRHAELVTWRRYPAAEFDTISRRDDRRGPVY